MNCVPTLANLKCVFSFQQNSLHEKLLNYYACAYLFVCLNDKPTHQPVLQFYFIFLYGSFNISSTYLRTVHISPFFFLLVDSQQHQHIFTMLFCAHVPNSNKTQKGQFNLISSPISYLSAEFIYPLFHHRIPFVYTLLVQSIWKNLRIFGKKSKFELHIVE